MLEHGRDGSATHTQDVYKRQDGHTQLTYRIVSTNSDVLTVNSVTGEVTMVVPVSSAHTSRGQYELMIKASDDGNTLLYLSLIHI